LLHCARTVECSAVQIGWLWCGAVR